MIAKQSLKRFKDKVRLITRRNRGKSLQEVIAGLNKLTPGWVRYFGLAKCKSALEVLDGWIRRKLRCIKLKHCKRAKTIVKFLTSRGIERGSAWKTASSGKGWWRLAHSPHADRAMGNGWFKLEGFKSLTDTYQSL